MRLLGGPLSVQEPSCGQGPIDAGSTDFKPLGNLGCAKPFVLQPTNFGGFDGSWPAFVESLRFTSFDTAALARFDEMLLDAADHAEDGEQHFAHHVRPVENDFGVIDSEDGSPFNNPLADSQQVGGVARQSVGMERKQDVIFVEQADGGFQLVSTVERRAIAGLGEHDDRAEHLQLGLLTGHILLVRAYPSVSKHLALDSALTPNTVVGKSRGPKSKFEPQFAMWFQAFKLTRPNEEWLPISLVAQVAVGEKVVSESWWNKHSSNHMEKQNLGGEWMCKPKACPV